MKGITTYLTIISLITFSGIEAGWSRTYGLGVGVCVQITSDGDYVITGLTEGKPRLLKTDTSGIILWERMDQGGGNWVEETSDGGFILAGIPDLLKTDSQGDSLWAMDFDIYSMCAQETSDGGFILVGATKDVNEKLAIIKTDNSGNQEWMRSYGDPARSNNTGYFVQETFDGGYIITGRTGIDSEEYTSKALWLVKINSSGDTLWTREYGEWNNTEINGGYCVRETSDDGYIVVGYKNQLSSSGGVWLLKTDSLGDTMWTQLYSSVTGGEGYSVQVTQDSGYIVVGTNEPLYFMSAEPGRNLWLIKTDTLGDTLWTRTYGDEGNGDIGYCVQQTDDKGFVITGILNHNLWLLRTDSLGLLGIIEDTRPDDIGNIRLVNSIGKSISVRYFDFPDGIEVSIFDACGRVVDELNSFGSSGIISFGEHYPAGVYFVKFNQKNNNHTERVVIIH